MPGDIRAFGDPALYKYMRILALKGYASERRTINTMIQMAFHRERQSGLKIMGWGQ